MPPRTPPKKLLTTTTTTTTTTTAKTLTESGLTPPPELPRNSPKLLNTPKPESSQLLIAPKLETDSSEPNKLEIVPKPDESSEPNKLEIVNQTRQIFDLDLNEPYVNESEEKQLVDDEIVVKEEEEEETGPIREEKQKQKEFEVFVGGLDRDAVEEDLEKVFNKIGEIVEVRLVKNRFSLKNKGFAFVRFATVEQAKKAAAQLNYTQIRGKVCEVTRNNDNETLHVGNICTTWTKDDLVEMLQPFELENLDDVHLIEDPRDKRKNRGYAFLNFSTHMDAVAACNKLQKGSLYLGTTVRADIAFAKSAVEPDEEIMSQVKSIFLDGLPPSWDEVQVKQHFQKNGEIDHVQLARNMPSAKRRDFGFISFKTREAALACIDAVNRDGIGEGTQKVLVRATLRKPLQRRVQSTGGWRGYSNDNYDDWSIRSSGTGGSYSNRHIRTGEWSDPDRGRYRGRDHRTGGYSPYSNREDFYEPELSPVDKYGGYSRYSTKGTFEEEFSPVDEYDSQFRREYVRQVPTTSHSRARGPYFESSSSTRRSSRNYEDFPASYSRERYDDDCYEQQYDYYENSSRNNYDYPTQSRMKRPYSAVDDEQIVSRSFTRRSRSGDLDLDTDTYKVRTFSSFAEYSRSISEARHGYDSVGYESRYSSGRGAPRSYDY